MVTHIEGSIYCIEVELRGNPLKSLNAYLIKGEARNLLIDTGFNTPWCRKDLLEGLQQLNVSLENTDIFITHVHSDHYGLATKIAAPTSRLYMSSIDRFTLTREGKIQSWDETVQRQIMNGFPPEEMNRAIDISISDDADDELDIVTPIEDGELFCYGGIHLRAILTPGHSPGHMCLYDEKQGIIFLGDHILFDITPNITYWYNAKDSLGSYIRSLLKIRDLYIRLPLPAHRSVIGTVPERVDEIIEHHAERLLEILATMELFPNGATAYQVSGGITWHIRVDKPGWENFPEVQKWFAVGETAAHLDYLVQREQIRCKQIGDVNYYWLNKYYPG